MTRRTVLLTLLGSGMQAAVAADTISRRRSVHPPRLYRTVGTNPRGAPVLSWRDALNYMQNHPKFQRDLTVLLPQGLDPEVREAYWPRAVRDVRGSVELAEVHHFMDGACPVCTSRGYDRCEQAVDLSHRFQRLAIPHGTRYLALTEGKDGRVTFNRIFVGDAIAYRVNVLDGKGYIDLIARCRNTGLGQRQEWEAYTGFTPPAPGATLVREERPPAPAEAVGGSMTTNNYYPAAAPPMAYIGPGQPQFYPRGYQAGSLTLWFRPEVTVRIFQSGQAAVGAAGGGATVPVARSAARPTLVVGPTTFSTPVAAAASAPQAQGPTSAGAAGTAQMQFPVMPTLPGASGPVQGQAQR